MAFFRCCSLVQKWQAPYASMFLLLAIASGAFPSACSSQELAPSTPGPAVDSILAKWQIQRNRLTAQVAAVVAYRATSRPPTGKITEAEFRRLWSQHDLADPKQLDAVAKVLDTTLDAGANGFTDVTLTVDDADFRIDVSHGRSVGSTTRHGDVEIWVRPHNKQVHIYNVGDRRTTPQTLPGLLYLPSKRMSWTGYTTVFRDDGATAMASPDSQRTFIIDSATGFVRDSTYWKMLKDNSVQKTVNLQSSPIDPTAELLLPRVNASATFRDDVLTAFSIHVIRDVKFNAEVSKSTFVVQAPKGTLLLDHRDNIKNPTLVRLDEDSTDILDTIDDPRTHKIHEATPKF